MVAGRIISTTNGMVDLVGLNPTLDLLDKTEKSFMPCVMCHVTYVKTGLDLDLEDTQTE